MVRIGAEHDRRPRVFRRAPADPVPVGCLKVGTTFAMHSHTDEAVTTRYRGACAHRASALHRSPRFRQPWCRDHGRAATQRKPPYRSICPHPCPAVGSSRWTGSGTPLPALAVPAARRWALCACRAALTAARKPTEGFSSLATGAVPPPANRARSSGKAGAWHGRFGRKNATRRQAEHLWLECRTPILVSGGVMSR